MSYMRWEAGGRRWGRRRSSMPIRVYANSAHRGRRGPGAGDAGPRWEPGASGPEDPPAPPRRAGPRRSGPAPRGRVPRGPGRPSGAAGVPQSSSRRLQAPGAGLPGPRAGPRGHMVPGPRAPGRRRGAAAGVRPLRRAGGGSREQLEASRRWAGSLEGGRGRRGRARVMELEEQHQVERPTGRARGGAWEGQEGHWGSSSRGKAQGGKPTVARGR